MPLAAAAQEQFLARIQPLGTLLVLVDPLLPWNLPSWKAEKVIT